MFSLVFAASDTAYSLTPIFLGLAESRILRAAPVDTRPRTLLISLCTVQLRTLCTANSLATLCLSTTCGSGFWEFPGYWGYMVFRNAPTPRKGSDSNNNTSPTSGNRQTFSPSYSSSQITYVEAEAVEFLRFRFHKRGPPPTSASLVASSNFQAISHLKGICLQHHTKVK